MRENSIVSAEVTQKVFAYIEAHENEMIADLKDLVRIPSVQGVAEPGMPFGRASAEAVEFAASLYEKNGFSIERRGERGYALARAGEGERTLGIFCHCDVVDPATGPWEQISDPFEAEIKDGYLIGRGTYDDKSAVVGSLYALKALKSAGIELRNRVMVYLGGNEETGMRDIVNFNADRQPMPDISLVPDCSFPLFRGEKSFSRFELLCGKKFERILDFYGGSPAGVCGDATVILPNEPKLKEELAAAMKGRSPSLSENGKGELVLFAKGRTTHPAAPLNSLNAGKLIAEVLLECPSLGENDLAIVREMYGMVAEIRGEYFDVVYSDETFGDLYMVFCQISMREGCLHLGGGAFYSSAFPFATLKEKMYSKCEEIGWSLTYTRGSKGFVVPDEHPAVQLILDTYHELCEIRNFTDVPKVKEAPIFFAVTYARHLKNAFPTGLTMPAHKPPAYFSPGHGYAHQSDECIGIRAYKEGVLYLAMMIAAIDREMDDILAAID